MRSRRPSGDEIEKNQSTIEEKRKIQFSLIYCYVDYELVVQERSEKSGNQ